MTKQTSGTDSVETWTDTEVAAIKAKTDYIPAGTVSADADTTILYTTAVAGGKVPVANTISDILHKDGSYTYDNTTDSLEAISDRVGAPTGASISADIADVEGKVDDIEGKLPAGNLAADADTTVLYTTAIAGGKAPVTNTLSDILHKDGSYTYDNTTDSLEAIADGQVVVDGVVDDILEDTTLFKGMIIADSDDFATADASADTARWTSDYLTGTEGGAADINTTTVGKMMVKVDPDGTPTAAMYGVGDKDGMNCSSKYTTWIIDVDATWGTPSGASYNAVGVEISNQTYDANNRIYIQKQKNNATERICCGAIINSVSLGEFTATTDDDAVAFKVERQDNLWKCYYSLTQYPTYTWLMLGEYEDETEYLGADARFFAQAYSVGGADNETVQGDFGRYRKLIAPAGISQQIAGDYDSGHIQSDADGSVMERQEYHTGLIGTEYANANGAPEVDNIRAHLFKTGGFGGAVISKSYTFSTTAAGAINLFTVTGDVVARVIPVITTSLAANAPPANICLGIVGDTDAMIGNTVVDDLDARMIWLGTSNNAEIMALSSMRDYIISDGNDIQMEIDEQVDSGAITFYCIWTPLSSDGNVVAA